MRQEAFYCTVEQASYHETLISGIHNTSPRTCPYRSCMLACYKQIHKVCDHSVFPVMLLALELSSTVIDHMIYNLGALLGCHYRLSTPISKKKRYDTCSFFMKENNRMLIAYRFPPNFINVSIAFLFLNRQLYGDIRNADLHYILLRCKLKL